MKKFEIIDRIVRIMNEKHKDGKIELIPYNYPDKTVRRYVSVKGRKVFYSLSECTKQGVEGSKMFYTFGISKHILAEILYEIGDKDDKDKVMNDMTLQNYAYISNTI